ncbi:MAG: hypothetical protein OMM_08355 [Candidatus Magnetoglobus multicellularis str. Araruama]|uniref:Uncharacterized protein n=1 Tax=Candidatus Magnetoglobus multicellularis str. Araruama TaxID=890399 RepID=A0A1V1P858_9BACT|nr:MAG: hypothetical protein OMM_08355 [Candidatus Magnetoglobus multicellularis str. Araruama]
MAKKPITGKSKLSKVVASEKKDDKKEKLGVISKKKKTFKKTYELGEKDVEHLKSIVKRVNDESFNKISEVSIIKGLIEIGIKSKTEKIIKSIKEAAF